MTNTIALTLFVLIAGIFVTDAVFWGSGLPVVVGKIIDQFIEFLSFWR